MKKKQDTHPYVQALAVMGMIAVGIIMYLFFAPLFGFPLPQRMNDDRMLYAPEGEVYYSGSVENTVYSSSDYNYDYEE